MNIADRLISSVSSRQPNFVIGGQENPYLIRWWVAPRNRIANVYLHNFKRSDDDRAHHDHPHLFRISIILRGAYTDHRILAGGIVAKRVLSAGRVSFAWGRSPHRVELHDGECWTLFITGPRVREWGFYCMEKGFVHWKKFTAPGDRGDIGKGCDA